VGTVEDTDIDGLDRGWVCAFEATDALQNHYVRALPLLLDSSANGLQVGSVIDVVAASSIADAGRPSVGYSPGKTWIAWRSTSAFSNLSTLRLRAFDSNSLTAAEGPFTVGTRDEDQDEWVAVATAYSGGPFVDVYNLTNPISGQATIPNYPSENAFVVWSFNDTSGSGDILGQAMANTSNAGSTEDLGGGCGSQGTVSFPKHPAIGTSAWRFRIDNLPGTTAAAFYNLTTAPFASAVPCGSCLWMPFEISGSAPLVGTTTKSALLQVVIPAKPGLVGAQMIAQWTLVDPLASPCPSFAGVSNGTLTRTTLGL
jgi:hypothetical protein